MTFMDKDRQAVLLLSILYSNEFLFGTIICYDKYFDGEKKKKEFIHFLFPFKQNK